MSNTATMTPGQREELEGLTAEMTKILDTAKGEGRELTPDELTSVKAKHTKAAEIRDKIALVTDLEDLKIFVGDLSKPAGTPGAGARLDLRKNGGIGSMWANDAGTKAWMAQNTRDGTLPGTVKGFTTPAVQIDELIAITRAKALAHLRGQKTAVYTGGAGVGSSLILPDRQDFQVDLVGEASPRIMTGLVRRIPVSSDSVEYVTITAKGTNNAAVVAESTNTGGGANAAPESVYWTYSKVTKSIDAVQHFIPVTRKTLADIPQMAAMIDQFLIDGLNEQLEALIISTILGDGGILTVGSAGTDLDAIVDGIKSVRVTGKRNPNFVGMHPNDWYSTGFALAKDSAGRYLLVDPTRSVDDGVNLWGRQLVISDRFTENTALIGDASQCVVWDRQQATVAATDSHSDWFTKGLVAVLGEARCAVSVIDPQAFCTVTAV